MIDRNLFRNATFQREFNMVIEPLTKDRDAEGLVSFRELLLNTIHQIDYAIAAIQSGRTIPADLSGYVCTQCGSRVSLFVGYWGCRCHEELVEEPGTGVLSVPDFWVSEEG